MYAEYFDKYGAPLSMHESWVEGYREVEKQLALVSTASTLLFHYFSAVIYYALVRTLFRETACRDRPLKFFLYKALIYKESLDRGPREDYPVRG